MIGVVPLDRTQAVATLLIETCLLSAISWTLLMISLSVSFNLSKPKDLKVGSDLIRSVDWSAGLAKIPLA
ncbi:hypothetical protein WICPIJ_001853 [Wickerhamomyces pijperi]|uniref:Uncharacterized protein n=1 Tax=Wickerhamomyces pijperi TaxID=599730 RepID=A0A9P8TPH4_WICPI|nr:hypothetical protein WICPIJ_001853 [Wickerhamomyces pijperi]